jgi:hypothetical protein
MSTLSTVVGRGYIRLQGKSNNGVDGRNKVFHEWASGRVLLNAGETKLASGAVVAGDYCMLIRQIHDQLQELGEQRLVPTIGTAKDSQFDLIVYVVLPES